MNASSLQSLVQLQALQQLTNSPSTNATSSSLFSDTLNEATNNASTTNSNILSQLLNQSSPSNSDTLLTNTLGLTSGLSNYTNATNTTQTSSITNAASLLTMLAQMFTTAATQIQNTTDTASSAKSGVTTVSNPVSQTSSTAGNSKISSNTKYDDIINEASSKYGISARMVKAVIKQESGFNPNATSSAGAGGLMQLMPGTAKYLGCTNVYDPKENIMAGTKYLKQMYDKYGSYEKMLAAYNAGPGNVDKYAGIPPFKETQNYVKNIMATFNK